MCEPKTFLPLILVLAGGCEPPPAPPPNAPATVVPVSSASAAPLSVEPAPSASPSSIAREGEGTDPLGEVSRPTDQLGAVRFGPAGAPPFDRGRAASTLGAVNVQSCASASGPRGPGRVKITFNPSTGVADAVMVEAPYAGTPVGACIVGRFRAASVPPFSGPGVTVGKSFTVN